MNSVIDTKIVCITSQSATRTLNGNFLSNVSYELGLIIRNDPEIIHRQVQLLNAQIPYSFYVINYTNNILQTNILGSIAEYTIPTGNYTANSLIVAIQTALGNPVNLAITVSPIDGKMTFSYSVNFTIYNTLEYSIGSVLGFITGQNATSVGNILTGTNPLNLLGIKVLQVRSSNLIMNNISSVQGGATTLLQSIPVSCVPFGMIDYTDKGNMISIHNDTLDDLYIDIVDGETGEYVNFNGQDWCITLAFHLTRRLPVFVFPSTRIANQTDKQSDNKQSDNKQSDNKQSDNKQSDNKQSDNNQNNEPAEPAESTPSDKAIPINPDMKQLNFLSD